MTSWKRTFGIHICCSVLVLAFLVAVPIVATSTAGEAEAIANAGSELQKDPLGRLPSSPEEAHQRLEERAIVWPEVTADGDFDAAAVQEGLRITIPYDTVEGFTNNPGQDVQVELIRGGPVILTVTEKAGSDGWFKADLSAGDIQSGDQVRVTDLAGGAPVTVNCTLTANLSAANDQVNGAAVSGNTIDIYLQSPSTYYGDIQPGVAHHRIAATGGSYFAAFPDFNIRTGDAAFVFSTSGAGHSVMTVATGSGGALVVYPQYDDVMGYYVPGTALTVNAGSASRNVTTLGDGFFEAWFSNHDIMPGETVAANMGGTRSIIVRDVSATCDPTTNRIEGMGPASCLMRITVDVYGDPIVLETRSDSSGAFSVNLNDKYTASGNEVYSVTWYNNAGDAVVYEFQTFSWYLAEGYTGGDFDTWVLVQNPGADDALVTMSFQLVQGEAPPHTFELPAGTRQSVHLDELPGLGDAEVSTMVTSVSGGWIVAERAVYFTYDGKQGGHDSIGALTPASDWYLAEGYTGGDFDTWVLVQNPGAETAAVTMSFQLLTGTAPDFSFNLLPGTRKSVHLDELPGLADAEVSTKISSNRDVVAERAEYFTYDGKQGGHDSIGVSAVSDTWYLAEGYTGGDFDTWVLVQNPGAETATVTMSFQLLSGTAAAYTFDLAPGTRESVHLDELPGLADAEVSTKVESDEPVVAERAMYFDYYGKQGGHDSIGTTMPRSTWYLAEGYTGGDFDTWVLIQNPGTEEATVTLSFQLVDGTAPDKVVDVPAGTRMTVHLDELPGLSDAQVSTKVESSRPVVAERAMYFIYNGKAGGSDSIGVPELL